MDKTIAKTIAEKAPLIAEYASLSRRLKSIAKTIVGDSRKELLAIAATIDTLAEPLQTPPLFRALQIYQMLDSQRSPQQMAEILGVSEQTVRQTINALKKGGIEIQDQKPPRTYAKVSASAGAEDTNEGRANDDRMEESIVAVKSAVKALRAIHDWDGLSVRKKIELLKQEVREARGTSISTQTLYRDWVRSLW